MTPTPPLTDRQAEVLAAIRAYWRDHGRPPAIRDLMAATGLATTNAVAGHLKALQAKGAVEITAAPGPGHATARGLWPAGLRDRIRGLLADDTTGGA